MILAPNSNFLISYSSDGPNRDPYMAYMKSFETSDIVSDVFDNLFARLLICGVSDLHM